jgi:TM2 domain-containing membrane protein YozV
MLFPLQVVTIISMLAATYLVFRAVGPRRSALLYTRAEKAEWDQQVSKPLGTWLALTNIAGTVTSLATVFLFFIGNSKVFGYWVLICSASIFAGAYVTNYFTARLARLPRIKRLLETNEQNSSIIASLFWHPNSKYQHTSRLVKYVSILNMLAVIWLEFSLFADISGQLMQIDSILVRAILLAVVTGVIFDFTLRFGLRGFIFADFLHAPLIAIASIALFVGGVMLLISGTVTARPSLDWVLPIISPIQCVLFAAHVICLNIFLVLVTEPHWLRVWAFGSEKITKIQVRSLAATALIWLLLTVLGFLAFGVTQKVGNEAIAGFVALLQNLSPAFIVVFWIGGIAALFSTADTQIYSLLVVSEFEPRTGEMQDRFLTSLRPITTGVTIGVLFALVYFVVRALDLPFEKIIFVVIPLPLNLLPAFAAGIGERKQQPGFIYLSLALYSIFAVWGFVLPDQQFYATLAAGLVPIAVAVGVYFLAPAETSTVAELPNDKQA